ncbi:MAG TPA: hypothetical protein PKN54_03415 [Candidatus Cloacimonas acidaminovorans]|nr:hypothetical protein [Candidatus Cloacimonas acidaminovorans]
MNKIIKFFRNIYLRVMINIELKRFYKLYDYYTVLVKTVFDYKDVEDSLLEVCDSIDNKLLELYDLE